MKIDLPRTYPHASIHRVQPPRNLNRPVLFFADIEEGERPRMAVIDERGTAVKKPSGERSFNWAMFGSMVFCAAVWSGAIWAIYHALKGGR